MSWSFNIPFAVEKAQSPSIHGYVTDGLVAMWDAIDNVGLGDDHHSYDTQVVEDLSGNGHTLSVIGAGSRLSWTDKSFSVSLYGTGSSQCALYLPDDNESVDVASRSVYIECVNSNYQRGMYWFCTPSITRRINLQPTYAFWGRGPAGARTSVDLTKVNKIAVHWASEYGSYTSLNDECWVNGVRQTVEALYDTDESRTTTKISINGVYGLDYNMFYGDWHATRLYNRVLTDAERAQNDAADRARFNLA